MVDGDEAEVEGGLVVREAVRSESCFAWASRIRVSSSLTRCWILKSTSRARVESDFDP